MTKPKSKPIKTVLVTGGAGYIGSMAAHALMDRGFRVVVVDHLDNGHRQNLPEGAVFVEGDIGEAACLDGVFGGHGIDAVMHFAGSVVVPESLVKPDLYYANNTGNSLRLVRAMLAAGVKRLVFSSTAAVYGIPEGEGANPIAETAACKPINPYGTSKYMTEIMLRDMAEAYGLQAIILRYFNVAGADEKGRCGQANPDATHLIKRASRVALGKDAVLSLFGTDYPTADGSAVRDYIHVADLIDAHLLALNALDAVKGRPPIYNCGYGHGYSVKQVIAAVERVHGKPLPVKDEARRAGDPPCLVADSSAIKRDLGWQPQRDDLDAIVASALKWEAGLP